MVPQSTQSNGQAAASASNAAPRSEGGVQSITSFSSGNADGIGVGGGQAAANVNAQIEAAAEQMQAKRAAFDAARQMVTQSINEKFSIKVPTIARDVKAKLRDYGVPITLFGEGE